MQTDIHRASRLAQAIIRVRLGLATEAEREFLVDWLDESEQNRQTYKRIVRGTAIREQLQAEDYAARYADYARLQRSIRRQLLARRRRTVWWLSASAAVAACVCGLFFFLRPDPTAEVVSEKGTVVAQNVDAKVKLILPSGEQVALDKTDSARIDLGHAVAQNGQLVYEQDAEPASAPVLSRVVTGVGGEYSLLLADGTRVWLNATSELEYPVAFNDGERVVRLKGEAYFEVAKDANRPFIVEAGGMRTRVLGTSFNIQAYDDETDVCATLVSGRVQVSLQSSRATVDLTPGREAVWKRGTSDLRTREADIHKATAWRHGQFLFDEENLDVVTRMLSRWYGVTFEYDGDRRGTHTFSGRMSKDWPLERTLEMVTLAGGPHFRREGNVVHVTER